MNETNPFEAGPRLGGSSGGGHTDLATPVPMEVGPILTRCWEVFVKNPGTVLGAVFLPLIPSFAVGGLDAVLNLMAAEADDDVQLGVAVGRLALNVVGGLINLFLQLGVIRIFMNLARGAEAELGMLVGEGANYVNGLLTSIASGFIIFFGVLLLIVPGIIAGLGLQFALYCVVDQGRDPVSALQESWRLTDGYKGTIFVINLAIAVLALVLMCATLGLGYFIAVPVLALVQAVMYHSLQHAQGPAPA